MSRCLKQGTYQYFGFIDAEAQVSRVEDYEPFLKRQTATYHTHKILSNYLRKQGTPKVIFFENEPEVQMERPRGGAQRNAMIMATHGTLALEF